MATGGEVAGSREQSSDVVQDYTCSTCSKSDQTTQASHYCPECDVCYCKLCLCDHTVLGRSKVEQWGEAAGTAETAGTLEKSEDQDDEHEDLKCLKHPHNDVELYCVDHDVVCCRLCRATQHRPCLHMEKIGVAADKRGLNDDIQNISKSIDSLKTKVDYLDTDIEIKKRFTESSHDNYIKQLLEMKTHINAKVDNIKKLSDSRKQQLLHAFNMDQVICTDFKDKVPTLKKELDSSLDKSAHFIKVKRTKEFVNDTNEKITGIFGTEVRGVFKDLPREDELKSLEVLTSAAKFQMSDLRFRVRIKEDTRVCEIVGICQIGNGNLLLADKANTRLKQLNRDYAVINHYKLQGTPNDMCAVDETEVAIAMQNKTVIIINVGTVFKIVRSLEMKHSFSQLAYHDDTFYCVNPSSSYHSNSSNVYICDKNGKNITGNYGLKEKVRFVEIRQDRPIMYVSDLDKIRQYRSIMYASDVYGISSFDPKGNKIAEYSHPTVYDVVALCTDDSGNLFVCKRHSREVIMLSQAASGHLKSKPTTVLSLADRDAEPGDHKPTPRTICYDRKLGRVVVGTERGDYIY